MRKIIVALTLAGCARHAPPAHPVLLESHPPPAASVADAGAAASSDDDEDLYDHFVGGWLLNRPVADLAHVDDLLCQQHGRLQIDARPDPDAPVTFHDPPKLCVKGACQALPSGAIASADGKLVSYQPGDRATIASFPSMKKVSDPKCPDCSGTEDDFGCGLGFFLGDDVYLGIGQVCEDYPARPFLAHVATGKPIGLLGGKNTGGDWNSEPGSYRFAHVTGDVWAVSGSRGRGGVVVVEDVKTGRVLRYLAMSDELDAPDAGPKGELSVTDGNGKTIVLRPPPCTVPAKAGR
jgi:hypothetical protein